MPAAPSFAVFASVVPDTGGGGNDGRLRCGHWLAGHKSVLELSGLHLGAYLVHVFGIEAVLREELVVGRLGHRRLLECFMWHSDCAGIYCRSLHFHPIAVGRRRTRRLTRRGRRRRPRLVYKFAHHPSHSTFTQSPSGDGGRKGGGDGARDPARDVARLHCSAAHSTKVWPSNLPLTRWRICTSCPTWRRPRPSQPLVEHMSSTFFSVLTRAHPLPEGSCSLTIARNLRTLLSPESMSGRRSATLSSDGGPSRRSVSTRG